MAKNPKNAVAEEQDDGIREKMIAVNRVTKVCLLYTSPSPRD